MILRIRFGKTLFFIPYPFGSWRVLCVTNATLFDSGLCVPVFLFTAVKILHPDFYGYSVSWSIIFCPDSWTSSVAPREVQAIGFILIRYFLTPSVWSLTFFTDFRAMICPFVCSYGSIYIFNGSTEEAGRLSF